MGENINTKMEKLEAGTALGIERFHQNFLSSGQASYILSEGHCSSDPSASENIESNEDITEDSQDKDWKVSYLDYQVDSDDEDMETASDRDLDPDYDKSPEPEWDDGDSEDSDYEPSSRSTRKKKCFRGKGRGRVRESYQSKIDKLKLSLTQDVMSIASNVKGGKDIIKLHSLLTKDTLEQDKMLIRQTSDVSDKIKKERDETLRKTVNKVLSGRNLLPSLCGSDISLSTVKSVANILLIDKAFEGSVQSSVVSGSHPSASLLLQSLIRTVQDNDPRTHDFSIQSSNSNTSHGPSVSTDGGKQNVEGLSGRSFLLLQHLALQEHQKKHRLDSFVPFTRFLAPSAYSSSNGGSVLKSMLTENLDTKAGVTSHRSDTTLLRKMLEASHVPPDEMSLDDSELSKVTDETTVSETKELSLETFDGYTVYVDQASSEEDVDVNEDADGDVDDDKRESEFQQIPDIPALMPVKIKTEPLSPRHMSGAAESPPQIKTIPLMQIKPEPLSPTSGTEGDSLASQEMSSRESEESTSAFDQNVIIKKEPDLLLTEGSREKSEDIQSESHTGSHTLGNRLKRSPELSTLESMQLKSEPVSPTLQTKPPDLWTNSCNATANVLKNVSKLQSSDIPDLNLRSLLVNDDNTLKSMLAQRAKYSHSQSKSNVVFQNVQKYTEERPRYEQTVSQKMPALKKVTSDGDSNCQRDGSGSKFGISASTFLQSLSRLSSTSSGNKDTILRGLMEDESSTYLDSPSHSYNTRHKRKHQDISPLVEDQDTPSVRQGASASKYHMRDSAEFKQSESLSQALNHSRTNVDGLQELDASENLSQNVNSCSQQLLNIIKSVGASKVTGEPKEKDVTILKSMLNNANDKEKFEATGKYPMMSRLMDTTTSSIGVRSTNFLNRSNISPPIQRSCSRVPVAKQVSKFRTIMPKPSTMGTPSQTQIASLRIGLRKRPVRSAEKSCSYDTGMSTLPAECPYQCRLCGSAFRSTPLLEEHMHVHFGSMPFGCNLCPQSFMTAKELEDHMKVHTSKLSPAVVYKCTVCGDVFDTEREHNEHRINHETCQQVQSTDHNKVRNSQHAHDQNLKLKNVHAKNSHTCKQCGEVFQDIHKYVLHVDEHSGWYKCEKCDTMFASKIIFQEHILNCSGQNYICSECGKTFMSKMDLNYHILFEHKQQSVTCGICAAVFCYESHLKEHEVNQHASELNMQLQGYATTQPNTVDDLSVDDLSVENGSKVSDMISLSVQRSSGSMAISDFAVQCMSDATPSEVVTISDSE
ncbi:uncharacterized protein [Haliotis asinina]|uniref:uncharacterized protein n=1 Tax=Haliotis asinina TaxID=109174 RepID=UPI003531805E